MRGTQIACSNVTVGDTTGRSGNVFLRCQAGVVASSPDDSLTGWRIAGNSFVRCHWPMGIGFHEGSGTIDHNLVAGVPSDGYGLELIGTGHQVRNNTIHCGQKTGTGIFAYPNSGAVLANNIVDSCSVGVHRSPSANLLLEHHLGFANSCQVTSGTDGTTRAVFLDPLFENPFGASGTLCFHMNSSSVALDLGDSTQTDPDGSRISLGRYGGTDSAGVATFDSIAVEDHFISGAANGWQELGGTWSGDSTGGTYGVTYPGGATHRPVRSCAYTVHARMRGTNQSQLRYMRAGVYEHNRVDLMPSSDNVRLTVAGHGSYSNYTKAIDASTWYNVSVQVDSPHVYVLVDGDTMHAFTELDSLPDGDIGLSAYQGSSAFDYCVVVSDSASATQGYLVDDQFGDGSTAGWIAHNATWTESGGAYGVTYAGETWSHLSTGLGTDHYTIETSVKVDPEQGKVVYRDADNNPWYRVGMIASANQVRLITADTLALFSLTLNANTWYKVEAEVDDPANRISVWVDGTLCHDQVALNDATDGYVGVGGYGYPSNQAHFDYFRAYVGGRSAKPMAALLEPLQEAPLHPHPNPFNPSTTIGYAVPTPGWVRLDVVNIMGQRVRALVDGERESGRYDVVWDGRDAQGRSVSSGVYLCRLTVPGQVEVRKITLVK